MIEVVSAVIVRTGSDYLKRVLLTQRDPSRSDYGYLWETPGGKVEPGESLHEAVEREVFEELDVYGQVADHLATLEVPRANVRLSFMRFQLADDALPLPVQALGLGWFTATEVRALSLTPGNVLFIDRLCALLG